MIFHFLKKPNKNFQSYKRDSVTRKRGFYHLSKLIVTDKLKQPTLSGLCQA